MTKFGPKHHVSAWLSLSMVAEVVSSIVTAPTFSKLAGGRSGLLILEMIAQTLMNLLHGEDEI